MGKKVLESVSVNYSEFCELEFIPPAKFYIKNALGMYEFIKVQKREVAQQWFDEKYGKGMYSVRSI